MCQAAKCAVNGRTRRDGTVTCPDCGGTGKLYMWHDARDGTVYEPCPKCRGKGTQSKEGESHE